MAPLRIALLGASGRMGQMIRRVAADTADAAQVTAELSAATMDRLDAALRQADVVIDFSAPAATAACVPAAAALGVPLVIGTTGLPEPLLAALRQAALRVPVLRSANMSLGVNVLLGFLERAARALADFDLEVVELHHGKKQDAPSGTALMMEQALARARGLDPRAALRGGRQGMVGARTPDEIGVLALRGGDVVGEHTAYFLGSGERVEIAHRAWNREIFARGALRAARWIIGRPPGEYDMQDVLGLR